MIPNILMSKLKKIKNAGQGDTWSQLATARPPQPIVR